MIIKNCATISISAFEDPVTVPQPVFMLTTNCEKHRSLATIF